MKSFVYGLATVGLLAVGSSAQAFGGHKKACCEPACGVEYQTVEKTVMVPTTVTEKRKVMVTECKEETRDKVVVCYQNVPETKEVERTVCVMVPEQRTKQVKTVVCKPVWTEQERTCTVMVPTKETREGTRKVCRMEQSKETRTVCVDEGCWQETCDPCTGCVKKCWVAKPTQKQVEVTVCKPVMTEEKFTYTVTVCKPEQRTSKVKVCTYQKEEQVKDVTYTVCVPQQKVVKSTVTVCKCVKTEKTIQVKVLVPHQVEKEIDVQVCKMVPKTITCKVAVPVTCAPACEAAPAPCCN